MNKSLLVLLALAIVSTNLVVAKATNNEKSCWCWDRCDGKIAKDWCGCEKTEKKVVKVEKAKKDCCWGCHKKSL